MLSSLPSAAGLRVEVAVLIIDWLAIARGKVSKGASRVLRVGLEREKTSLVSFAGKEGKRLGPLRVAGGLVDCVGDLEM